MTDAAETFSRDWLELREPVDHRSRATALVPLLDNTWRERGWSRILDLGSGTGSNARYLAPRVSGTQAWTLLDRDPALLEHVGIVESAASVTCLQGDLDREGIHAAADAHLVTCSALLDLVPARWLRRLVETCCRRSAGAYLVLTFNGLIRWSDGCDPDDEMIHEAVRVHQQRDQGTATALGPTAATVAERLFRSKGYRTWRVPSPWHLTEADGELARALIDGWERAALDLVGGTAVAPRVRGWAERRRHTTRDPEMSLTVGHDDLLALPAQPEAAR